MLLITKIVNADYNYLKHAFYLQSCLKEENTEHSEIFHKLKYVVKLIVQLQNWSWRNLRYWWGWKNRWKWKSIKEIWRERYNHMKVFNLQHLTDNGLFTTFLDREIYLRMFYQWLYQVQPQKILYKNWRSSEYFRPLSTANNLFTEIDF